jgi:hypothetical protein
MVTPVLEISLSLLMLDDSRHKNEHRETRAE